MGILLSSKTYSDCLLAPFKLIGPLPLKYIGGVLAILLLLSLLSKFNSVFPKTRPFVPFPFPLPFPFPFSDVKLPRVACRVGAGPRFGLL